MASFVRPLTSTYLITPSYSRGMNFVSASRVSYRWLSASKVLYGSSRCVTWMYSVATAPPPRRCGEPNQRACPVPGGPAHERGRLPGPGAGHHRGGGASAGGPGITGGAGHHRGGRASPGGPGITGGTSRRQL